MPKYTKGKLTVSKQGIQFDGIFSPWRRFCVGLAIALLALAPLIHAIRWW